MTQITNFNKFQLYTSCQKDVKLANLSFLQKKKKKKNKKRKEKAIYN
jgi:hypothetical protein